MKLYPDDAHAYMRYRKRVALVGAYPFELQSLEGLWHFGLLVQLSNLLATA